MRRLLRARLPLPRHNRPPQTTTSTTTTSSSPLHFSTSTSTSFSQQHQNSNSNTNSNTNANGSDDKKSALLDREAVNTESNEYSKSGSDARAAGEDDPAFRPGRTDPEAQLAASGGKRAEKGGGGGGEEEGKGNPLEVSPANHEISQPKDSREGGAESGPERRRGSGGGGGEMKKGRVS